VREETTESVDTPTTEDQENGKLFKMKISRKQGTAEFEATAKDEKHQNKENKKVADEKTSEKKKKNAKVDTKKKRRIISETESDNNDLVIDEDADTT
jgi:hypothetical protein